MDENETWPAPDYRAPKKRPLDRALLIADEERVHVLAHIGPDLDALDEAGGTAMLVTLFELAEFNAGVWMWEGRVETVTGTIDGEPGGFAPVGKFRPLTGEEWSALRAGGPMWDPSLWFERPEGVFVIKLQLSLAASDGKRRLLAYNQDRSVTHEEVVPENEVPAVEALLSGQPKGYFEARLNKAGLLDIGPAVPNPGW